MWVNCRLAIPKQKSSALSLPRVVLTGRRKTAVPLARGGLGAAGGLVIKDQHQPGEIWSVVFLRLCCWATAGRIALFLQSVCSNLYPSICINLYVCLMHPHLCFFTFCFPFPSKKPVNILVGDLHFNILCHKKLVTECQFYMFQERHFFMFFLLLIISFGTLGASLIVT